MPQLYFGIENLALTGGQKQQLIAALRALGPVNSSYPVRLNHIRTRLDNDAAIFEAQFGDNDLTSLSIRQYLANVFSVPTAQVTAAITSQTFSVLPTPIVTLTYQSVQRIRFALFGGTNATHAQSRAEVQAYLALNAGAWEEAN